MTIFQRNLVLKLLHFPLFTKPYFSHHYIKINNLLCLIKSQGCYTKHIMLEIIFLFLSRKKKTNIFEIDYYTQVFYEIDKYLLRN